MELGVAVYVRLPPSQERNIIAKGGFPPAKNVLCALMTRD